MKIESANTPEEAVKKLLTLIKKSHAKGNPLTEFDSDILQLEDKKDWKKGKKRYSKFS